MFNDVVSIYHLNKDDTYSMVVIENCYWYGTSMLNKDTKGTSKGASYKVFFTQQGVEVSLGDICVLGEGSPITTRKELSDKEQFTITGIDTNIKGSKLDHIMIYGD